MPTPKPRNGYNQRPDASPTLDDDVPPDNPLTTKEGAGAFVRHTPEPPTLLSTEKLAAAAGPTTTRCCGTTTPICRW
jgi:hypothetical protein